MSGGIEHSADTPTGDEQGSRILSLKLSTIAELIYLPRPLAGPPIRDIKALQAGKVMSITTA